MGKSVQNERFSWDDEKAASNVEKHDGVTFEEAAIALDDVNRVERWDQVHSSSNEDR